MATGKVKFFNQEKGFGFITKDSGVDVFFHISGTLDDDLREGDQVSFEETEGKKGVNAVNVQLT